MRSPRVRRAARLGLALGVAAAPGVAAAAVEAGAGPPDHDHERRHHAAPAPAAEPAPTPAPHRHSPFVPDLPPYRPGDPLLAPGGLAVRDDLGDHHRPITTLRPDAQAFFDQGLRLAHRALWREAEASFREAARRDPSCVACAWGVALALTPPLHRPPRPERVAEARARLAEARRLAAASPAAATGLERDLVAALDLRFSDPPSPTAAAQRALERRYAETIENLATRVERDADLWFLAAESLLRLERHRPRTETAAPDAEGDLGGRLERALAHGLALAPDHPGLLGVRSRRAVQSTVTE